MTRAHRADTPSSPRTIAVVLATYNQPRWLEKVLWGYAVQTWRAFEVVIADDGSGAETREVIDHVRTEAKLPIRHVWHEDRGFRKSEILNRAILATDAEYLIFSDGDCIPRDDLVAVHARFAAPGRFLSGGYLKLPASVSERITLDDIRSGRVADMSWLRAMGWKPGHRALRLTRSATLAAVLDAVTPTGPTWNGHNASTWRTAILAANGFDLDMPYGGQDRALGERLVNLGLRGRQIRHRAPCMHLDHGRPYRDQAKIEANLAIRRRIREHRETRARLGITELDAG